MADYRRPAHTISLAETARRLGFKYLKQVHDLRCHGEIEVFRVGSTWCVVAASVERYKARPGGQP